MTQVEAALADCKLRLGLPEAVVLNLLKRMLDTDYLADIDRAQGEDLTRLFHTIKGSAGNLGLTEIAGVAAKLEVESKEQSSESAQVRAEDVDKLKELFAEFRAEMETR